MLDAPFPLIYSRQPVTMEYRLGKRSDEVQCMNDFQSSPDDSDHLINNHVLGIIIMTLPLVGSTHPESLPTVPILPIRALSEGKCILSMHWAGIYYGSPK